MSDALWDDARDYDARDHGNNRLACTTPATGMNRIHATR